VAVPAAGCSGPVAGPAGGVGRDLGWSGARPPAAGPDAAGSLVEAGLAMASAGPVPVGAADRRGTVLPVGGRVGRVTRRLAAGPPGDPDAEPGPGAPEPGR
jgi:hypothetical protein